MQEEFDIRVEWRGFELHPETPVGGRPIAELFPARRLVAMRAYMKDFAAQFGILDMRVSDRLQNTRRSLAMAEFARDQGKVEAFRTMAMNGYWREGMDLENPLDLGEIARLAGLDPEAALKASTDPGYLDRVREIGLEAAGMGVTGIPTFFFGQERVVGCQPYEVLARAAEKTGARRRLGTGTAPD